MASGGPLVKAPLPLALTRETAPSQEAWYKRLACESKEGLAASRACGSQDLDMRILAGAAQVVDVSHEDHHRLLRQGRGCRWVKHQGRLRIGHVLYCEQEEVISSGKLKFADTSPDPIRCFA